MDGVFTIFQRIAENVVSQVLTYITIRFLETLPNKYKIVDFKREEGFLKLEIKLDFVLSNIVINMFDTQNLNKLESLLSLTIKNFLIKLSNRIESAERSGELNNIKIGIKLDEENIHITKTYLKISVILQFVLKHKSNSENLWKLLKSLIIIIQDIEEEFPIIRIQENIICEISNCNTKKIKEFVKIFNISNIDIEFFEKGIFSFSKGCILELDDLTKLLALKNFL